MLGSDIATRVKQQFGDEAGAQITDAMILNWINDGQNAIVARSDELFQVKATASTTNGVGEYDLPTVATDIVRLHRVIYKGQVLEPISIQEAETIFPNKDDAASLQVGIPGYYWIWGDKINLMPVPNNTGVNLTIYFQKYPTAVAAIGDELTLPRRYHLQVKDYCIAQASELDDDDERYATKMGQFNADIDMMQRDSYWRNQDKYPFPQVSEEDAQYGYC